MELPHEAKTLVRISEIKGLDSKEVTFVYKISPEPVTCQINESKEIVGPVVELDVVANSQVVVSAIVDIGEDKDAWVDLSDVVSVKLYVHNVQSSTHLNMKPVIQGLIPAAQSSCDYIKRLQEIEEDEREITSLLAQSRHKAPVAYKDYLDSSPRSTAKRSPLKKKTLDTDNFADFEPDYKYQSFYNVGLENISSSEVNLLETAVVGMMSKLRSLRYDVDEYEINDEIIMEFESPMKNLKDSVEESKSQIAGEDKNKDEKIKEINSDIKLAEKDLETVTRKNESLQKELEALKKQLAEQRALNEKEKVAEGLSETQVLRNELAKVTQDIQSLEGEYAQITEEFVRKFPEQELAIAVNEKLLRLSELHRITTTRDASLQEGMQLLTELISLEGELQVQQDRELQDEKYKEEQGAYSRTSKHINLQLQEIKADTEQNLKTSERNTQEILHNAKPLQDLINLNDQILEEKKKTFEDINSQLEYIQKNNSQLELILDKEKQIINEHTEVQKEYISSSLANKATLVELENISNDLLKVAENSITAGRLLRRAEDMVEEQELQQVSMHKLIAMIKATKPAYIAVQNDAIDMALAKYLNARHKTLDVNFKRTDKEKYVFGSLKVEIKQEDEMLVVVEGRKLKIEEFLEAYTPGEKEKTIKRSGSKTIEKKLEGKPPAKVPAKAATLPLAQSNRKAK